MEAKLDAILNRLKNLEAVPTIVDEIKNKLVLFEENCIQLNKKIDLLEFENQDLRHKLVTVENKLTYLEDQSRRANIVIRGLKNPDEIMETWDTVENLVIDFMKKKLDIHLSATDIERAHRITNNRAYIKPIVVKLVSYKKKTEILKSAYKLKGTNVVIQEDFCSRTIEERKALLPVMKKAKDEKKKVSLVYNKLRINSETFIYDRKTNQVRNLTQPRSVNDPRKDNFQYDSQSQRLSQIPIYGDSSEERNPRKTRKIKRGEVRTQSIERYMTRGNSTSSIHGSLE